MFGLRHGVGSRAVVLRLVACMKQTKVIVILVPTTYSRVVFSGGFDSFGFYCNCGEAIGVVEVEHAEKM